MKVGLFIPCYINALYPEVGEASYKLLTQLGVEVDYPLDQTCCGQPMANAGYERDAKALAERMEALFAKYDYVVGPSASCVVFVKEDHTLFENPAMSGYRSRPASPAAAGGRCPQPPR